MFISHLLRAPRALLLLSLLFPALALALPPIQHWTLPNGVRVYFMASPTVPIVDMALNFDAGSARDPRSLQGLAMLTNSLLGHGAGSLRTGAINRREDDLALAVGQGAGRDMAGLSADMLAQPRIRRKAVRLLARILTQPTFPTAAIARKQRQALLSLRLVRQSLGATATRHFYPLLYGRHPYGQQPDGTRASLSRITRPDIEHFYHQYYVGRNASLAIVGDLSLEQARRFATDLAGGLPAGAAPAPLPPVPPLAQGVTRVVPFHSVQTQILIGAPAATRTDPDVYALILGNYILGGDPLESRLGVAIRQKRALSYTTYSSFALMQRPGPFVVGVLTRNDQRARALAVARRTLNRYVRTGPTAAELVAAKRYIAGSFPLGIDSDAKLVSDLSTIGFYRLPLNYLTDFVPHIQAVTRMQVRAALRRYVHPRHLVTLLVGGGE